MDDLEIAKQRLKTKKQTLVFVKNSKVIFESNIEGLKGFIDAIETHGKALSGTSVADKVLGKAAALLCLYSKISAVFAVTASQSGLEILKKSNIRHEYENLVYAILDLRKADRCPFEKLVENVSNPKEAFGKIKRFCKS